MYFPVHAQWIPLYLENNSFDYTNYQNRHLLWLSFSGHFRRIHSFLSEVWTLVTISFCKHNIFYLLLETAFQSDVLQLAGKNAFLLMHLQHVTSHFLQHNINVLCTSPCTTGYHEGYSQTKIDTQANNSFPGNYLTVKETD